MITVIITSRIKHLPAIYTINRKEPEELYVSVITNIFLQLIIPVTAVCAANTGV